MKEWLEDIILSLGTNEPSPKRLGTAVTLTCAIKKFFNRKHVIYFEENVMIALLRMMALTYATAEKEYNFLQRLMRSRDSRLDQSSLLVILLIFIHRKQVITSVTRLFTYAADKLEKRKEYFIDYMKALPLIHFVRDDYNPHDKTEVVPSKVEWGDESLKLHSVRDAILHDSGYLLSFSFLSLSCTQTHTYQMETYTHTDMTCMYMVSMTNEHMHTDTHTCTRTQI